MTFDPINHHRRSIRLKGYDYTQNGSYFVTICTQSQKCILGNIIGDKMQLNDNGQMVKTIWEGLSSHYLGVQIDAFVVMPNHVHGIIVLVDRHNGDHHVDNDNNDARAGLKPAPTNGDNYDHNRDDVVDNDVRAGLKPAPTNGDRYHGLPEIVRGLKTFSSRQINELRGTPSVSVWHRNYYEHIIRNDDSLWQIQQYINDNPARWAIDSENPYKR